MASSKRSFCYNQFVFNVLAWWLTIAAGLGGRVHAAPPVLPLPPGMVPPEALIEATQKTGPKETIVLVGREGPLPSVVTTDKKTDRAAAADLCNYLSRVTARKIVVSQTPGAKGVIVHVGRDAFVTQHAPQIDKLYADGYILKCVKVDERYHLILAGKLDPSSQWAVERFLKDYCGVRWLFPDPRFGEIVPRQSMITFDSDLSKTYEPDYAYRENLAMY